MKKSIVKPIVVGILIGALAFFAPLFILFFLIIAVIMKLFFWRRHGKGYYKERRIAFTDKIRNMSEEEYSDFKTKMEDCHCY